MSTCYCEAPATTGQLCTIHLNQLRMHLWRSPEILRELDVTITNQAKQGGNNGTGERMAFNEAASDRRQDVLEVLRSAAHDADPQLRHRFAETPAQLVARALGNLDTLARSPGVHTVVQDLADALEAALLVMGRAAERRVLGLCECGNAVTTTKDSGVVTCRRCGIEYDVTAWDEDRLTRARDRSATITQLAGYFTRDLMAPVTTRTLQRWAEKKLIVPLGGEGPARFRIGDVMDAWEAVKGRELPGRPKKVDEHAHAC